MVFVRNRHTFSLLILPHRNPEVFHTARNAAYSVVRQSVRGGGGQAAVEYYEMPQFPQPNTSSTGDSVYETVT